jgi:hypothetical protein
MEDRRVMPKPPPPPEPAPAVAPLSPGIRRHLGRALRAVYADAPTAPVPPRLEALVAQLDKPKR